MAGRLALPRDRRDRPRPASPGTELTEESRTRFVETREPAFGEADVRIANRVTAKGAPTRRVTQLRGRCDRGLVPVQSSCPVRRTRRTIAVTALITPRGFAPRTPLHPPSLAASTARVHLR